MKCLLSSLADHLRFEMKDCWILPFQSFDDTELYPSLLEKTSRLGYGLIKNHPFVDGNKRIGTHAMLVFLAINNAELSYSDDELIQLILGIAAGEYNDKHLLNWLQQHLI